MPKRAKDQIAAAEMLLHERYSERLESFFKRMTQEDSVSDCIQECFLRVIEGFRNETIERFDLLDAYVYGVARRVLWNHHRHMKSDEARKSKVTVEELISSAKGPAVGLTAERLWSSVEEALAELSRRDEDLLRRRYQYDQEYETICDHYGLNQGAIRTALSRARQRLLRCLFEKQA